MAVQSLMFLHFYHVLRRQEHWRRKARLIRNTVRKHGSCRRTSDEWRPRLVTKSKHKWTCSVLTTGDLGSPTFLLAEKKWTLTENLGRWRKEWSQEWSQTSPRLAGTTSILAPQRAWLRLVSPLHSPAFKAKVANDNVDKQILARSGARRCMSRKLCVRSGPTKFNTVVATPFGLDLLSSRDEGFVALKW